MHYSSLKNGNKRSIILSVLKFDSRWGEELTHTPREAQPPSHGYRETHSRVTVFFVSTWVRRAGGVTQPPCPSWEGAAHPSQPGGLVPKCWGEAVPPHSQAAAGPMALPVPVQ